MICNLTFPISDRASADQSPAVSRETQEGDIQHQGRGGGGQVITGSVYSQLTVHVYCTCSHVTHLTVAWDIEGEDYVLDLKLNRDLIPDNYFEKYHHEVKHFDSLSSKEQNLQSN